MHRFADGVISTEGEGNVRDSAGDFGVREIFFDPTGRVDEVEGVVVVLFDAGGDGEDVGVEDDVFGREANFIDEDVVGAFTDTALVFVGRGLTLFIEGHDDDGGSVVEDVAGVFSEGFFAFFKRDGVNDSFALEVLESFGDDLPFGGVDHDGDGLDIGLGLDEVEETGHHGDAVDESIVEADVDDVGAVGDLLAGHFEGGFEIAFLNKFPELG